MKSNTGKRTR